MSVTRRVRWLRWTLGILLVTACGEAKNPAPALGNSPATGAIQLTGSERLVWMQPASSLEDLRAHTYHLYINDGPAIPLTDVQCSDAAADGGYECAAHLPSIPPGSHLLTLTSMKAGVESTRSEPISVIRLTSGLGPALAAPEGATLGTSSLDVPPYVCFGASPDGCYEVRVVATGTGHARGLHSTGDGRLLVVEGRRRLRFVVGGTIVSDPAVELGDPAARIAGVAVDPRFESTRFVFIAWTDESPYGERQLHITRYRELGNVLAEAATIVTGLGVADADHVPLVVTAEGHVYVALPAPDDGRRWGAVLRYQTDGGVPEANVAGSPVIAAGLSRPMALAIHPSSAHVWLGGSHGANEPSLARLSGGIGELAVWRGIPDDPTLSISGMPERGQAGSLLLAAERGLVIASLDADLAITGMAAGQPPLGTPLLAATTGPDGSWLVMTGSADAWSVLQLRQRRRSP